MKKSFLLALILLLSCLSGAHAEIPSEKRHEIEKMLRLTGMEKLMDQMMTQMITSLKAQLPTVQDSFWEKFQKKMDARELLEKLMPVYDKYYTIEDLKAVNAFYESPAGKKVLLTLPQVMKESMKIGQEWGQKLGKQAAEESRLESAK